MFHPPPFKTPVSTDNRLEIASVARVQGREVGTKLKLKGKRKQKPKPHCLKVGEEDDGGECSECGRGLRNSHLPLSCSNCHFHREEAMGPGYSSLAADRAGTLQSGPASVLL